MTNDKTNVVPFERPLPKPARLEFCEFRLDPQTCAIELTVVDECGDTFVLKYSPPRAPEGFSLARLAEAWEGWKGSSQAAS